MARVSKREERPLHRLSGSEVAKFTAMAALFAILADAAIGHGLTWENDPYWTYWITKTFLIATVIGFGTAMFGIGVGRGALIVLAHTLILTVYYWTLSPIGLPAAPHWLDLEHTWISGVPIHFGVIYLGYLLALWVWRRRPKLQALPDMPSRPFGLKVLAMSLLIVILAGGLSNLALGEFTGITWYVARLLLSFTFILLWRAIVGRDILSSVVGGIVLAFIWAVYSQYLSPAGLPDVHNLRIFSQEAPPSAAHWLDYNQLWLISFPIYVVVMVSLLVLGSLQNAKAKLLPAFITALAAMAAVTLLAGLAIPDKDKGGVADISAGQGAVVETGDYYGNDLQPAKAGITIHAKEAGNRVTPLPPRDEVYINAQVESGGHIFSVTAMDPMVEDPMGQFTTWWGVGTDVWHHGKSGIGTSKLPPIHSKLAVFGMGDIKMDGRLVAAGVPIHAMTAEQGLPGSRHLELDVGDPRTTPLPGIPSGHIRVLWDNYHGEIPGASAGRYTGGDIVLGLLVIGGLLLNNPTYLPRRK